ncbi:MAG: isoprenyl transferase [Marinilabiliaceae bacterium]|jgi:undecaprenyl diphosphate synthase|nr:isoprenyl transferase [Marinilabiliaceae bacterium]
MSVKDEIIKEKLPRHVAIIMDGNGRWAKSKGSERLFGHKRGVNAVRQVTEAAVELGIEYLTLYAFSTENWNRPKLEIEGLMLLLMTSLESELKTFINNDVRLRVIGNDKLPKEVQKRLKSVEEKTAHCKRLTLVLALSYSSRWEITNCVREVAQKVSEGKLNVADINENIVSENMATAFMPDPELLIRTSGEQRISNFLLWQIAYTELYFTQTLWPDFGKEDFYKALVDYQGRERRFGKTSEQINN